MSADPPFPVWVVAIACGVLVWSSLVVLMTGQTLLVNMVLPIVFGVLAWVIVLFGGLVLHDTIRRRGMWGINFKPTVCTQCGTRMPVVRKLADWRQALWGGGSCPECGLELDK